MRPSGYTFTCIGVGVVVWPLLDGTFIVCTGTPSGESGWKGRYLPSTLSRSSMSSAPVGALRSR